MNPLLNEMEILAQLAQPCTVQTGPYTRTAAFLVLAAAYDRKFDREPFIQAAQRATHLIEAMRRVECLALVHHDVFSGTYTIKQIKEAVEVMVGKCLEQAEEMRVSLHHTMRMITECAYEEDTIN